MIRHSSLIAHLPTYLPTYLHTYLPTYLLPTYLPTYVPTYLPICLLAYLPTYPPTHLPTYLPTYLPVMLLTQSEETRGALKESLGTGGGLQILILCNTETVHFASLPFAYRIEYISKHFIIGFGFSEKQLWVPRI